MGFNNFNNFFVLFSTILYLISYGNCFTSFLPLYAGTDDLLSNFFVLDDTETNLYVFSSQYNGDYYFSSEGKF